MDGLDPKKCRHLPDLAVDTKVFVKEAGSDEWEKRHFKKWAHDCTMHCYRGGTSSFTAGASADDAEYNFNGWWRLWKVADGRFKGETNHK